MKRTLVLLLAIGVSTPALAGFRGPMQLSIGLAAGKSMNGVHGHGTFASVQLELSRRFLSRTEVTSGIQPMFIEQPSHFFVADGKGNEHAIGIQSTLGIRHHFSGENANTRLFVELASGPLFTNKRVPTSSSRVNFYSYGTAGATFRARNGYAPYAGVRFGHISNAGIVADRNPGYNIASIVFGFRRVR
jgi:hypothetical protein